MRDPARIEPMLAAVRKAWERSPDLRLFQLLLNALRHKQYLDERTLFFVEDEDLLRAVEAFGDRP